MIHCNQYALNSLICLRELGKQRHGTVCVCGRGWGWGVRLLDKLQRMDPPLLIKTPSPRLLNFNNRGAQYSNFSAFSLLLNGFIWGVSRYNLLKEYFLQIDRFWFGFSGDE